MPTSCYPLIISFGLLLIGIYRNEAQPTDNGPYMTRSLGFINMFNRSEPFLLLVHDTAIMLYNDKDTCWNSNSIYYALMDAEDIRYVHYSTRDNYLAYYDRPVNDRPGEDAYQNTHLCFKNLFKSQWNRAMFESIGIDRCGSVDHIYTSLSMNHARRAIYGLASEYLIYIISFFHSQKCQIAVMPKIETDKVHVTNFHDTVDYLFATNKNSIQRFNASGLAISGEPIITFKEDYTLKYIDSDSESSVYVLLTKKDDSVFIVQEYNMKDWPNMTRDFTDADIPNSGILCGFSVITGLMVFAHKEDKNITLSFVPVNEQSRYTAWKHTCRPRYFPRQLLMVDPNAQYRSAVRIMDEAVYFETSGTCEQELFEAHDPEGFQYYLEISNMWYKLYLILGLTIMALIVATAYYLLENQKYS